MDSSYQKINLPVEQQHQLGKLAVSGAYPYAGVDGGSFLVQRIGKHKRYRFRVYVMQGDQQVPYQAIVVEKRPGSSSGELKLERLMRDS